MDIRSSDCGVRIAWVGYVANVMWLVEPDCKKSPQRRRARLWENLCVLRVFVVAFCSEVNTNKNKLSGGLFR